MKDETTLSRRSFVKKTTALSAAGLTVGLTSRAFASGNPPIVVGKRKKSWGVGSGHTDNEAIGAAKNQAWIAIDAGKYANLDPPETDYYKTGNSTTPLNPPQYYMEGWKLTEIKSGQGGTWTAKGYRWGICQDKEPWN